MTITQIKTNKKVEKIVVKEVYPKYTLNDVDEDKDTNLDNILELLNLGNDELDSIYIETSISTSFTINFTSTELPHCCGIYEIGDLSTNGNIDITELTKILDGLVRTVKKKTLIINTNGKGVSVYFEKALAKCKYFTMVKSFKNGGTSSTIKMWISNNE